MAMEINQVEAFLAIVQVEGFSRAATILHLSQPAISRRISLLEQELGVTLFDRVHSGIVLTQAGQAFLPHARRIVAAMRDGIEAVQSLEEQEQGIVNIALVGTLASTDMTQKLLNFRQRYPQVQLRLRTARSFEVSNLVQSGDVHLGIRYFADSNSDIISQLIDDEPLVVVCSPNHPLAKYEHLQADDLRGIAWLAFPIGRGTSSEPFARLMIRQLQLAGLGDAEIIPIDSLTAQKRLIEADFGIGLLPLSSVQEELRLGTLHILKVEQIQTSVPVMVLYRQAGYMSKATRTLLNELIRLA